MLMWVTLIVVAFLSLSLLAALTFYCAAAVAGRAEENAHGETGERLPDEPEQRPEVYRALQFLDKSVNEAA